MLLQHVHAKKKPSLHHPVLITLKVTMHFPPPISTSRLTSTFDGRASPPAWCKRSNVGFAFSNSSLVRSLRLTQLTLALVSTPMRTFLSLMMATISNTGAALDEVAPSRSTPELLSAFTLTLFLPGDSLAFSFDFLVDILFMLSSL